MAYAAGCGAILFALIMHGVWKMAFLENQCLTYLWGWISNPMEISNIIILVIIGLAAGALSGMFGIGGGLIIVPSLVFFLGMTQHGAQGTSLGLMLLPVGILAAWNYWKVGNLNIQYGLIIALTFVVGGYFGSKISLGLDEVLLKRIFGVLMLVVAVKMILFPK